MKTLFASFICMLSITIKANNQINFDHYFTDHTLRIDYYHTGDANSELFTTDKIYMEGIWAGNPDKCIQPFEMGIYKVNVYDIVTNNLIFSKGYNSIFAEYQTTRPALQGIKRTYHETVLLPCPKRRFLLVIEKRNRYNILSPVYTQTIDPTDYHINNETHILATNQMIHVVKNGDPHKCVDLVILAEGYMQGELDRFKKDLKYYSDLLFRVEPYRSNRTLFNLYGIFSPSEESGTDEPRQGIFRNTYFSSSFNTFDLDRYCLAEDNKRIRDVAAGVPYDAILIMVNTDRYGGGGIYNWQAVYSTGSPWRDYVFLHEFGHTFAGLGDEYFSSPVAYENFYTAGVEPLEPNITALLDTANVKWKQYLSPGIKVPTDWGKGKYDSLTNQIKHVTEEWNQIIGEMKKSVTAISEIERVINDFQEKVNKIDKERVEFIKVHPLKDKVGVFEGANYLSDGLYRPTINSLMHTFDENKVSYGIVNEQAIISTIIYYTGD